MKKLIAMLLISSMVLPSLALGDDKKAASQSTDSSTTKPSTDGPAVLAPLQKGQPAPYPGILFSPRAAASVAADISSFPERLRIEVDGAVKKAEARKDFTINENNTKCKVDKNVLVAKNEASLKRIDQLQVDIDAVKSSMPNRSTWLGIGVASGIVVTLLTVFVVGQAIK